MSKKLQQKQDRRRAEEARRSAQRKAQRRTNLLTVGAAVVVLSLVVGGIIYQRNQEEGGSADVGVAESEAGCTGIEEFDEQGADHIDVGSQHEPYNSDPPTSGPHYAETADLAFYTEPLPPEQLVHNLEHGQIVIWYDPSAPQEIKDQLEEVVDQERVATLAVPYDGVEEPNTFVLSAWGALQSCEKVSQAVVDEFRRTYQGKGPEQLTPPFDG